MRQKNIRGIALFCAVSLPAFHAMSAENILIQHRVSLTAATTIRQVALEQCRKGNYKVSVTVVDRAGRVLLDIRDDDASPHTVDSSRRKAYSSMAFRTSTGALGQRIANNSASASLRDIDDVLVLRGGLPINSGEETIGAVGVAGAPGGDKDEDCAKAGLEKAGFKS